MSSVDILILVLILAAVTAAVIKLVKNRRSCGCCSGCNKTEKDQCGSCKRTEINTVSKKN